MRRAFQDYTLLSGSHGLRGSLWRGPDHLLVIEGRGFLLPFREHYRRIDYENIQALTLRRTHRWMWMNALLVIPLLLLVWGLVAALAENPGVAVFLGACALLLLLLLIINLMRGQTCRCSLQTSVQMLPLRPLTRVSKARPVLDALEKICREHQSHLPDQPSVASPPDLEPSASAPVPMVAAPPSLGGKPRWPGSRWVLAAGLLVSGWGAALAAELYVPGTAFSILNLSLGVAAFLVTLIGLVRVLQHESPGGLQGAIWTALGLELITGMVLYGLFIAAGVISGMTSVGERGAGMTAESMFDNLAGMTLADTGPAGWGLVALGGVLFIIGLFLIPHGWRSSVRKTPPPQPMPPLP